MQLSNDTQQQAPSECAVSSPRLRQKDSLPRRGDEFADSLRGFLNRLPGNGHPPMSARYEGIIMSGRNGNGAMILSIGEDSHLLGTRQLILESVGYRVHSASGNSLSVPDFAAPVDITIICHTVKERRILEIVSALRRAHPLLPILHLGPSRHTVESKYDYPVEVLHGPRMLLQTIDQTLRLAG